MRLVEAALFERIRAPTDAAAPEHARRSLLAGVVNWCAFGLLHTHLDGAWRWRSHLSTIQSTHRGMTTNYVQDDGSRRTPPATAMLYGLTMDAVVLLQSCRLMQLALVHCAAVESGCPPPPPPHASTQLAALRFFFVCCLLLLACSIAHCVVEPAASAFTQLTAHPSKHA